MKVSVLLVLFVLLFFVCALVFWEVGLPLFVHWFLLFLQVKFLKWLAQFPVDRIATPQTSLEDAFIQYYRKETGHER